MRLRWIDARRALLVAFACVAVLAVHGVAFARSPCPGSLAGAFPERLRVWLTKWPSAVGPAPTRDPVTGSWRMRPGLILDVQPSQRVRIVAPGRVVSARCGADCTVAVDHGDGYVARYGGLAEAGHRTGECVAATTAFRSAPPAEGRPASRLVFSLSQYGRFVDPRSIAGRSTGDR